MGRVEYQGLVSAKTGEPLVQMRILDDDGNVEAQAQLAPGEAREVAQGMQEAATNAVYDASMWEFATEHWPDDPQVGAALIEAVRRHRADAWGIPDQPEDWRR